MDSERTAYRLARGNFGRISLIFGLVAILATLPGLFLSRSLFFHAYLTSFVFWFTIAMGGLFFVMLHHLTDATWSVVLRRISENVMAMIPLVAILFIPILLGIGELYRWSHADIVAHEAILQKKSAYLNVPFFVIRAVIYFGVWIAMSWGLYKISIRQDGGHEDIQIVRMRRISGPGMVAFALTLTFASFDWIMSLNDAWYSTIFGVYLYAGSTLAFLAFMTLAAIYLKSKGPLSETITFEHFHDLGKLIFTFIVFWGYIAFSQYFLIWYGNIPEETIWYKYRWADGWKPFSLIIIFGQFCLPFLALMPRAPKRNLTALAIISVFILIMHWIDIYWLIMPSVGDHKVHFSWMDITALVGLGGIFLWYFYRKLTSAPLVPVNDPRLAASIEFIND